MRKPRFTVITIAWNDLPGLRETRASVCAQNFSDFEWIIVDGGTSPREVASTIIDLTDEEARWQVMREGAIPAREISEFFAEG